MDTDLLSKMLKELVRDEDTVCLPGLGTFYAEIVPATFSDRGYTVNPPYRRLSFRQRQEPDTKLADLYAVSNGVDGATATKIVSEFLGGLKQVLRERKVVVFSGLGKLRATKENNFFFVPDEDLDIYPDGFGLESVSLKTHEETPEEVSAAVSGLAAMMAGGDAPRNAEAGVAAKAEMPVPQPTPEMRELSNGQLEATPQVEVPEEAGTELETEFEDKALVAEGGQEVDAERMLGAKAEGIPETGNVPESTPETASQPEIKPVDNAETGNAQNVNVEETPETENVPEGIPETASVPEVKTVGGAESDAESEAGIEGTPETEDQLEARTINSPEPDAETETVRGQGRSGRHMDRAARTAAIACLILIAVVAVLLGGFLLLAWLAPDFIDSLLYTSEELWVIRY